MTLTRSLGALLLLVLAAPAAFADTPQGTHRPRDREGMFRLADAYLERHLQESLGLTDDEFARAVPLVREVQASRRQFFEERASRLRVLRDILASGTATEAAVEDALRAVQDSETNGPARLGKAIAALDQALTPLQRAKYRVFEAEVEARIRRLLVPGGRYDGRHGRDARRPDRRDPASPSTSPSPSPSPVQ